VLDEMPIFVDPSAAGTLLPGEDTMSQNVLIDKIFGGKKLVYLVVLQYRTAYRQQLTGTVLNFVSCTRPKQMRGPANVAEQPCDAPY